MCQVNLICFCHFTKQIPGIAGKERSVGFTLIRKFKKGIAAFVLPLEERLYQHIPLREESAVFARVAGGGGGLYSVRFIDKG